MVLGFGGSVNPNHLFIRHHAAENSAALDEKGEADLQQPRSELDPYPLVETSIFLPW